MSMSLDKLIADTAEQQDHAFYFQVRGDFESEWQSFRGLYTYWPWAALSWTETHAKWFIHARISRNGRVLWHSKRWRVVDVNEGVTLLECSDSELALLAHDGQITERELRHIRWSFSDPVVRVLVGGGAAPLVRFEPVRP